ncbi:ComF family protein [Nocardiopsis gilva]|uniref:ComF family protein n=1 Tax=Nocardiopsis gilva TaxID=280236 RepID=UPI001E4116A0|nr:hypothetical protein [Nocardiopsis gilva]
MRCISCPAVLSALVDLLLGERCAGCGRAGTLLCAACAETLDRRPRRCATRPGCPPVWAAGPYAGCGRDLLLRFKDGGVRALSAPLGRRLARAVAEAAPARGAVVLVPVPPRTAALRRRGFDPVALLARAAAEELCRGAPRGCPRPLPSGPRARIARCGRCRRCCTAAGWPTRWAWTVRVGGRTWRGRWPCVLARFAPSPAQRWSWWTTS